MSYDATQHDKKQFATGAVRSKDADGERWDLIPVLGLLRVAQTCAEGAAKYGVGNWLKGIPVSDLLNHAIRHIYLYLAGDRSEDHLAHAAWNLLAACHMELTKPEMKDCVWQTNEVALWADLEGRLRRLLWKGCGHAKDQTTESGASMDPLAPPGTYASRV